MRTPSRDTARGPDDMQVPLGWEDTATRIVEEGKSRGERHDEVVMMAAQARPIHAPPVSPIGSADEEWRVKVTWHGDRYELGKPRRTR